MASPFHVLLDYLRAIAWNGILASALLRCFNGPFSGVKFDEHFLARTGRNLFTVHCDGNDGGSLRLQYVGASLVKYTACPSVPNPSCT